MSHNSCRKVSTASFKYVNLWKDLVLWLVLRDFILCYDLDFLILNYYFEFITWGLGMLDVQWHDNTA